MPTIKFIRGGCSSLFGNFAPGDVLKCSEAEARHFVEDASCAKYLSPAKTAGEPPDDQAAVVAPAVGEEAPEPAKAATQDAAPENKDAAKARKTKAANEDPAP